MTFSEAQTALRNDVLAESSTDYFTNEDLLGFVKQSAKEIALNFGFPTALAAIPVSAGDTEFELPSDVANVDLNEVSIRGFSLSLAPYRRVVGAIETPSIGVPRFYNWEPKRGGKVLFGPPAKKASSVLVEYVREYDVNNVQDNDALWEGLFPAYHELVVFRSGVKAFEASLEIDRAQYWLQREQARMQEFAAFLNETPMNRLVGQEVAES